MHSARKESDALPFIRRGICERALLRDEELAHMIEVTAAAAAAAAPCSMQRDASNHVPRSANFKSELQGILRELAAVAPGQMRCA